MAVIPLGVLCTAATFVLTYRVIAEEGATHAATVGYLLPVVSVTLGMVVVLGGVAMTRWSRARAAPPGRPPPSDRRRKSFDAIAAGC
ncbi:MAG TPA: hypothetical protein VI076_08095 [Actinopolymorphaceae bacterium]